MVRLKEYAKRYLKKISQFQFLYGAIKSYRHLHFYDFLYNFNSFMVRLKAVDSAAVHFREGIFQFLYGAIKSLRPIYFSFNYSISIPLWCD